MVRRAFFLLIPFFVLVTTAFTPGKGDQWQAVMELEGLKKPIILVSDVIYGGYNPFEKKYFFFGKNHMFGSKSDPDMAKIYQDLCVTNSSGQFEFEILKIEDPNQNKTSNANISFKKRFATTATLAAKSGAGHSISVTGDLKQSGIELTPEAQKVMTGKFKLTFKSQN